MCTPWQDKGCASARILPEVSCRIETDSLYIRSPGPAFRVPARKIEIPKALAVCEILNNCPQTGLLIVTLAMGFLRSTSLGVAFIVPCAIAITVSVTDFGGRGDGRFDNAQAFSAAVAAVADAGGGTVFVPAGRFVTSPFNLSSQLTLLLGDGAALEGSADIKAWPLLPALLSFPGSQRYAPIIGCYSCSGVTIATNGSAEAEFDGGGLPWWLAHFDKSLLGDRPHMLEFIASRGVDVSGLHLHSSPYWTVRLSILACLAAPALRPHHPSSYILLQVLPYHSQGVHFHDMSILNIAAPNGDGIDPAGSADVLIERVNISTSDDAIAIKSGTIPGFPPASNITVRDSDLSSSEACVAIGSEMASGVFGVHVYNVTCRSAGHAPLYIKSRQTAGGIVADVLFEQVLLGPGVIAKGLWLSQHFGENGENVDKGDEGGALTVAATDYPTMRNITMRETRVVPGTFVVQAAVVEGDLLVSAPGTGGAGVISNVTLDGVDFGSPTLGWACANTSGTWSAVSPKPCSAFTPVPP